MNPTNTKVYWTPDEIVLIVKKYIERFGNSKPSIELFNSAVASALPAERRGAPLSVFAYNKRGNFQVTLMLIHEKQGHPERNSRFEGEFGERSKYIFEQAHAILFNKPANQPLSSTIVPTPVDMNDADSVLLKLADIPLSVEQVKFVLSHSSITPHDMGMEIERRRYAAFADEVQRLRNEMNTLKAIVEAIKAHPPEVVVAAPAPAAPEPEKPKLRKVVLITNISSQIASYENELDKLDVDILSRNDVPIHMINPKSEAIIVLAKFTNHSNRHNAKKISSQYGIPFFEIHGTGQLKALLKSMNDDADFWQP